ncbi:MAG: hypothetical protein Q8896_05915 [Bacteroidota bacterium]|nr:hypothetical protein [Bacteroidota bacterium]MDP4236268.1 hypothetical protein [Bacteroidota bacterium]
MKILRARYWIILLLISVASINSCNRPDKNDPSKAEPAVATPDTPNNPPVVSTTPINPGTTTMPKPSSEIPQPSQPSIPAGSMPILRPQQLAEFHPRLPDFMLSKVKEVDQNQEAQSIILFRYIDDTSRYIISKIMDANEKGAGKLIMGISDMQKKGQETRVVEGESITSYYLEIKGMPAIKAYIASRREATLFILVGDHRAVSLREFNVSSPDHLVEAAKTIDFAKFESLARN